MDPINNTRGIGVFHADRNERVSYKINNLSSIKSIEMIAIMVAIKQAIEKGQTKITIFTDSLSSVKSLENAKKIPGNKYYENYIGKLCCDNQQANINIVWVPAHTGIIGNEIADKLAKSARHNLQGIFMEPTEIVKEVKKKMQSNWAEYYRCATVDKGAHLAKITNHRPATEPWFLRVKMQSNYIKTICRIMTGHAYNDKTLHLMRKTETDKCKYCQEIDTNDHILFTCKGYSVTRRKYPFLVNFNNCVDMFNIIKVEQYPEICKYLMEIERNI